jgi:nudix-type nucleoside diphosphatase (YffH/AdpP family)
MAAPRGPTGVVAEGRIDAPEPGLKAQGMLSMSIEIRHVETAYAGWAQYLIATVRLADGATVRREIEHHGAAACVLPYDPGRRTAILVRQFRAPVFFIAGKAETFEAIAGLIEDESPMECARREALEEAGIRLKTLEPVGAVFTMPGLSTERMHLFLAAYDASDRIGEGGGLAQEHEGTLPVETTLSELAAMADAGSLTDLKTLAVLQTLRTRRPELFTG